MRCAICSSDATSTISTNSKFHEVTQARVQAGFFLHGTLAPVSKTRFHEPLSCFGSERDPFRSVPISNSQYVHVPGLAVVENLAVTGDQGVAADARGAVIDRHDAGRWPAALGDHRRLVGGGDFVEQLETFGL